MQRILFLRHCLTLSLVIFICCSLATPLHGKSLRRFPCDPKFGHEGNYIEITTGKVAAVEKMPYESKLFSLSARSTPLRDVLLGLSKQADLNLVIERGVNSNDPVSVELFG